MIRRFWQGKIARLMGLQGPLNTLFRTEEYQAGDRPVPMPNKALAFFLQNCRLYVGWRMLPLAILMILAQSFETLQHWALGQFIDHLADMVQGHSGRDWQQALWLLAGFWVAAPLCLRLFDLVNLYVTPDLRTGVKSRLFEKILAHGPTFFLNNASGHLSQRVHEAARATQSLFLLFSMSILKLLTLLSVSLFLLSQIQLTLAGLVLVWAVAFIGGTLFLAQYGIDFAKYSVKALSHVTGRLVDTLANMEVVRHFGQEKNEAQHLNGFLDQERLWARRNRLFWTCLHILQFMVSVGFQIILAFQIVTQVSQGTMAIGTAVMCLTLGLSLTHQVRQLTERLLEYVEQITTLSESIQLIAAVPRRQETEDAVELDFRSGNIDLENVSFHYPGHQQHPALSDINLTIRGGEKIGIVGRSGAGKTSLLRMIARDYDPQSGQVRIDGQNLRQLRFQSLTQHLGIVAQQSAIFDRSVAENIRYGGSDVSEAHIWHCLEQVGFANVIRQRPEGLQAVLGEKGFSLSGGEKQRLAIARILVKNPGILLLDEATASLDSENERKVQQALEQVMTGRTVIAIAHRLATLRQMDRLIVLDGGRIVAQGRHDDLLAAGGLYAHLWQEQQMGMDPKEEVNGSL